MAGLPVMAHLQPSATFDILDIVVNSTFFGFISQASFNHNFLFKVKVIRCEPRSNSRIIEQFGRVRT